MNDQTQQGCPHIAVGIEREALRVTPKGHLAQTAHPAIYGDKLDNPYITVDYAEQQIELISPPAHGAEVVYSRILALTRIAQLQCRSDGELLWPSSLPPVGITDDEIEIAHYRDDESGRRARAYREDLAQRYGKIKQLFSGIHYNVSCQSSDDERYLRVVRNFLKYGWFLIYAWGAAPEPARPLSISIRQGEDGYHNLEEFYPDYSSVEAYCQSIQRFVDSGAISEPKEYYAPIRIKPADPEHSLESLRDSGIRYLEIRVLDVDPFDETGISLEALDFLERFVAFLSDTPCNDLDEQAQRDGDHNRRIVADRGLDPALTLRVDGREVPLVEQVEFLCAKLGLDPALEPLAKRIHEKMASQGFQNMMIELAELHQESAYATRWLLPGFEEWELSTQLLIREAVKRGIAVMPLDAGDNLIRLTRKWAGEDPRSEYVMQATRTGADTYITPLLMNNKTVSKLILDEQGIATPLGEEFTAEATTEVLIRWEDRPAVIKPKSTNFGVGVTIFTEGASLSALNAAAQEAFTHDETILVETYIQGIEYRFLVIDDEVCAVMQRKPANVVGDGVSTIEQLVTKKNEHPYRSRGYRSPLNTIVIDDAVREFIARDGYDPQSVPTKDETVFLRPNSNISTGGDSIDVTDRTDPYFKDLAVAAARAFNAMFCGVDLIIEDLTDPNSSYGVIEVNWNPAIHVHHFPLEGVEREIAGKVLEAIGLI